LWLVVTCGLRATGKRNHSYRVLVACRLITSRRVVTYWRRRVTVATSRIGAVYYRGRSVVCHTVHLNSLYSYRIVDRKRDSGHKH
jgi:hypothetical protein